MISLESNLNLGSEGEKIINHIIKE